MALAEPTASPGVDALGSANPADPADASPTLPSLPSPLPSPSPSPSPSLPSPSSPLPSSRPPPPDDDIGAAGAVGCGIAACGAIGTCALGATMAGANNQSGLPLSVGSWLACAPLMSAGALAGVVVHRIVAKRSLMPPLFGAVPGCVVALATLARMASPAVPPVSSSPEAQTLAELGGLAGLVLAGPITIGGAKWAADIDDRAVVDAGMSY